MDQQKQQQQATQDGNKQPIELQYEYIDQIQTEQVYHQHDVRMKRHPELQPYVPSDRYTTATTTITSTGLTNNNRAQAGSRTLNNKYGNSRFATSSSITNQAGVSGQPKKYCSMTRLNQLAQPKKRPATNNTANNSNGSNTVNTATTLSSTSSNRSLNSISKSSDKVRQQQQQQHQQQKKHDRWQPDGSFAPQSAPRPQQQLRADRFEQRSQQQKQQAKIKQQHQTPQPGRPTVAQSAPRPQQQQRADRSDRGSQQHNQQAKNKQQEQERRNSEGQHITPRLIVKSPLTPSSTPSTVVPTSTPQSFEWNPPATVVHSGQSRDKINTSTITSTPTVQLPTPASSLEEELQSAANNESSRLLNTTRDVVHDTSSLADQVAEISVNECFYQSAASDLLVPDSENSTSEANGIIDYDDRNPDSLCREFEQDLIAKGIVGTNGGMNETFDNFTSPRATIDNSSNYSNNVDESIRRNSAATIVTSEHSQSEKALQDEEEDEDDRRIKAERELREKARLEEEERKQREQLVENIMSRFSQGSQVS